MTKRRTWRRASRGATHRPRVARPAVRLLGSDATLIGASGGAGVSIFGPDEASVEGLNLIGRRHGLAARDWFDYRRAVRPARSHTLEVRDARRVKAGRGSFRPAASTVIPQALWLGETPPRCGVLAGGHV